MCQSPLESLLGLALTVSGRGSLPRNPAPPEQAPLGEAAALDEAKDSSTEDSCQQPRMCASYFGTAPSRDQNASFYELCSFDPGRQRRGITNTLGKHWDVSEA